MKKKCRESISETLQDFLERRRFEAEQNGWTDEPLITPDISAKAQKFWHDRGPMVARLLEESKLSNGTIEAVIEDYKAVLCGTRYLTATVKQMKDTIAKVDLYEVFCIDPYGFYYTLLHKYYLPCINTHKIFMEKYFNTSEEFIPDFLNNEDIEEVGKRWIMQTSFLPRKRIQDYAVERADSYITWVPLNFIAIFSEHTDFVCFYALSKYGYKLRKEVLGGIRLSLIAQGEEFNIEKETERVKKAVLLAERQYEEERAEKKEREKIKTMIISRSLAKTQSMPMGFVLENDTYFEYPIVKTIENYLGDIREGRIKADASLIKYFDGVKVSERTFASILTGVLRLRNNNNFKKESRSYFFQTTKTDFAKLCGYNDPGESEIKALLFALKALDGLTVTFIKPPTEEEIVKLSGEKVKLKSGVGFEARTLFSAVDFIYPKKEENNSQDEKKKASREKGVLSFRISDLIFKEDRIGQDYILLNSSYFEKLKKALKGLSGERLAYQIIIGKLKKQHFLISEIFGYKFKTKEEISNSIRMNRKQLWQHFETLEEQNLIQIKRRPSAMNDDAGIWEWEKMDK